MAATLNILRDAFTAGPMAAFPDMEAKYQEHVAECQATGIQPPQATEWLWKEGGRQLLNKVSAAARRDSAHTEPEAVAKLRRSGGGDASADGGDAHMTG